MSSANFERSNGLLLNGLLIISMVIRTKLQLMFYKCSISFYVLKSAKMLRKFLANNIFGYFDNFSFVKKNLMVPRGINMRFTNMPLTEGRQVWNAIHQSTHITGWKGKLGDVRHLTLNTDCKFFTLSCFWTHLKR